MPPPRRRAAFVLPPHLSAGLGGTAQVGAGTAAAAAHPRSRAEARRGGKARLCRAAAAAPGAAGGGCTPGAAPPAAGGGGGHGTFFARLFPQPCSVSSCCAQRDATAAARSPGEGRGSEVGERHQPGRSAVGLPGEGPEPGGAAGGVALPLPRCPRSRPRSAGAAAARLVRRRSHPRGARRARARRRRAQGWAFPPFSPATERRDTRSRCWCMHLADLAWEGLRDWGEAAFEPAQPVVNYRLQLKF